MTYILIKHRVKDYSSWRPVYDSAQSFAGGMGQLSSKAFQEENDPNLVTVLSEFDTKEHGEQFINSTELKQAMERAGVLEQPEIHFLNAN